jgi:WD40-like Beta Propeller Repeat
MECLQASTSTSKGCSKRSRNLQVVGLICLSAVLSACAGIVGPGSPETGGGDPAGSKQPAVSLSVTSLAFGNQTVGTTSTVKTVMITNTGLAALTSILISPTANYAETNNCGASLNVGAKCTINVTFVPSTIGTIAGKITIGDNASGSPQSVSLTGAGMVSSQPSLLLSTKSLTFAAQTVGSASSAQNVTLTNTGSMTISIMKITVTGNYGETNTCGGGLSGGGVCTVSVTFIPSSIGTLTGTLTITDSAPGSPQSVSITGMGSTNGGGGGGGGGTGGSPGTGCSGAPLSQVQTNVTSQLSYVNTAAGATVSQLTDVGSNRFYYFDVQAYSPAVNEILYVNFGAGDDIVTSNTDGTDAQFPASTLTGTQAFLSGDGKLAYFDSIGVGGSTPGGRDVWGIFLNTTGVCQAIPLTNLDVPPQPPLPVWEISGTSPDAGGGYDLAVSPDTLLHRFHIQPNGTSQALPTLTLNDPESAATFHRLRLNPKFPNIVMYKRNDLLDTSAQPEVWVVDLNTCTNGTCAASNIVNIVAGAGSGPGEAPGGGHIAWSPDGLDIAFSASGLADYWIARNVVNSNGSFNPGFTLQELGPLKVLGKAAMTADYCAFPPTWPAATVLACLAGAGSPTNPKMLYLMSSDGKGTTKLLTATDAQVLTINGTPMPQFAQDGTHLMFNSDRTGVPQIYLVSGFTLTVP